MYNSNSENSQIEDGNKAQTRKSSIVAGDEVVLNENSKDIDEKTKKLLNKKIVIGIICILAIIMCVVIYSVLLSKNNNEQENELSNYGAENNLETIRKRKENLIKLKQELIDSERNKETTEEPKTKSMK